MMARRQRGILLLPVALTLAIVGTLAYTMTREGSMDVSAVDAQYDLEVARYLAASGVQVAKWRAAKDNCNDDDAEFGTLDLPGGKVTVSKAKLDKENLSLALSARTSRGSVHKLEQTVRVFDLNVPRAATMIGGGDDDTTIVRSGGGGDLAKADTLTASEDNAHPLVYFRLPGDLERSSIIQADLRVSKKSGSANQPVRTLAVHRITRDWTNNATWTTPWATAGGDYVATPAASVVIDPGNSTFNGVYAWRIDSLAQIWANNPPQNFGLLLKPTGMTNVSLVSFNGANKPELVVRYYKRCT